MIHRVLFPVFDANITEGMVGSWVASVGDTITVGAPLVDIVTDKADFTLESEVEGTLRAVIAAEKSTVPNGYILALIGDPDDELPDVTSENDTILAKARQAMTDLAGIDTGAQQPAAPRRPHAPSKRIRATPAARRLARENNIDLADIRGQQPVTEQAVRDYLQRKGNS